MDNTWPSHSIEFKASNNNIINRSIAIGMTVDALKLIAPASRTDFNNPDISILFRVINKTVMLSCIRNFMQKRKMSLSFKNN